MRLSLDLFLSLICAAITLASCGSRELAPRGDLGCTNVTGQALQGRDDAKSLKLRILPLGASITWGYLSSTGNGYRKPLRDQLRFSGYEVDMVGTKQNGDMIDRDVEAHIGDTVDQVRVAAQGSFVYQPNLVLINAGTNDCLQSLDIDGVGARMEKLINLLLDEIDGTTVVLSTLIPCADKVGESHRSNVNNQYRELAKAMQSQNKRVVLADMDPPFPTLGHGWLDLSKNYADAIHPNDEGYSKMASIWWSIIQSAIKDGIVQSPNDPGQDLGKPGNGCKKHYGDGVYAGGWTQAGSGEDDGTYHHNSKDRGVLLTVESDYDRNQWFFARLYSRNLDDFVGWYERDDGSQWYGVWRNTGRSSTRYVKISDMSVQIDCIPSGVNFVDVNGDGLDDFVCIGPEGDAYAAINNGDGSNSKPPTFTDRGRIKSAESGFPQSQVRLGDVDGDGRVDYCVFKPNGDMSCWRNGWVEDTPAYWQPLGQRFHGRNMGNLTGVHLEDVNGDGRDDWVWIGDDGETYLETNSRSCRQGRPGDGLYIAWRPGYWQNEKSGPSHPGMGVPGVRSRIHFARVFATPEAFGLLGRQDYAYLEHSKAGDKHKFQMRVWENLGGGSTKLKADGNKYCNMMGHSNGMMDYIWTHSTGKMTLYPNRGKQTVVNGGPSFWDAAVVIWDPSTWGAELDRRDLHLVDWDGDGACDIVWVDPDNHNKPQLWRNLYKSKGKWDWEHDSDPAPDLHCPESRGVGIFDLPVKFADISGNGRGDYLCMEKDGRTWGYVHKSDGTWEFIDQFKYAEGKDRANLHWADVNGDGKADLLWTDKFSGDGYVWYNNGRKDIKGSRFEWVGSGKVYMGNRAGQCMYYPDLQGDRRADMHAVAGSFTNQAETWFNQCAGDAVGDDDNMGDPKLPAWPGSQGGVGELFPSTPWPTGDLARICGLPFNSSDLRVINSTWTDSGSAIWFRDFLDKYGAKHWTDTFFTNAIADGEQGGSTYICDDLNSANCPGPLSTACTTYNPPMAFFVHLQIGFLYSAYSRMWAGMVEDGIVELATTIKTIVDTYGTPPQDENSLILGMLVGIFASLAGFAGFLGTLPAEEAKFMGDYVNPLTVMSGAMQMTASNPDAWDDIVSADDLEKKLEDAYGSMFKGVMNTLGDTVKYTFDGQVPAGVEMAAEDWVYSQFADGAWLSKAVVNSMVDGYVESTKAKWVEFATARAMNTGNERSYKLLVSTDDTYCYSQNGPTSIRKLMTKDYCIAMDGCIWHDNRCLCFGYLPWGTYAAVPLDSDEVAQLKKFVPHYSDAMINNYECVKYLVDNDDRCSGVGRHPAECKIEDPTVPTQDDLDFNKPTEFSKCFFNFGPILDYWVCSFDES